MSTTIALFGAGAMGSAVGRRLAESGARVITFLEGRSKATIERARAAGLEAASLSAFAEADIILSIVPPAEALKVADLIAPVLRDASRKPPFVDLNAISPKTMETLAAKLAPPASRSSTARSSAARQYQARYQASPARLSALAVISPSSPVCSPASASRSAG